MCGFRNPSSSNYIVDSPSGQPPSSIFLQLMHILGQGDSRFQNLFLNLQKPVKTTFYPIQSVRPVSPEIVNESLLVPPFQILVNIFISQICHKCLTLRKNIHDFLCGLSASFIIVHENNNLTKLIHPLILLPYLFSSAPLPNSGANNSNLVILLGIATTLMHVIQH